MNAENYGRQLEQLLPRGPVWLLGRKTQRLEYLTVTGTVAEALDTLVREDSVIRRTMLGIGEELARVEQRGRDLVEESDPRTATELLEDWERLLGLPDDAVLVIPSTTGARRRAIISKLVGTKGQTPAFFEDLAFLCGYTAVVYDGYGPLVRRCGFLCGATYYGLAWAHAWKVTVTLPGASDALLTAELERIIRRARPAHTVVIFEYV